MIRVVIPGVPYAQKRHRVSSISGHARAHDHPENRSWKGAAQVHMLAAMDGRAPLDGPLALCIRCWFPLPVSAERKTAPRPAEWHPRAKDYDNIAKAVGDAGNAVLWVDDRLIVSAFVEKMRCAQGDTPRTEISLREAGDLPGLASA